MKFKLLNFVLCVQVCCSLGLYTEVGEFTKGMLVYTEYVAPTDSSRSIIDICSNGNRSILLRLNARYDERALIVRSMIGSHWQTGTHLSNFPFTPGIQTKITIFANDNEFDIYANGGVFHHPYTYPNGISLSEVNGIKHLATGNTRRTRILIGKVLPDYGTSKVVYIHGRAPQDNFSVFFARTRPDSFSIDEIDFMFIVWFNSGFVARNTRTRSTCGLQWGAREKDGGMPFVQGEQFTIAIVSQQYGFEVSVNGRHFTTYTYRVPLVKDLVVMVNGVLYIEKIEYY